MNKWLTFCSVAFLMAVMAACTQEQPLEIQERRPDLPAQPHSYTQVLDDAGLLQMPSELNVVGGSTILTNSFEPDLSSGDPHVFGTITSDEAATLGRVLFYDNRLSKNNSIACASCHKQELAFADDAKFSEGFGGKMTDRNSMTIANPMFNSTFFWDGRSRSLTDLALKPVFNHVEMGMSSTEEVVSKLQAEPYYEDLFLAAFGTTQINAERIERAISDFVTSFFSSDSRFDKAIASDFADFNNLERHGLALFFSEKTQCASCHNGINFSSPTSFSSSNPYATTAGTTNIGLDLVYDDPGFANGKFKIPSLRNIALTAPYMHDGRFTTIREVLDHYNDGIKPHEDLDVKLHTNGIPLKMGLTELDLDALEAFLRTLTGQEILSDKKYSNPF